MSERDELLRDIMSTLAAPTVPEPPKPLANDATHEQKAAYEAARLDYSVHQTLAKPIDQVTVEERTELLRQIRECEKRGWT